MNILLAFWSSLITQAAIVGALAAARVDYLAFSGFKSAGEAAKYDWSIAAWRWLQGAVIGAVSARMVGV